MPGAKRSLCGSCAWTQRCRIARTSGRRSECCRSGRFRLSAAMSALSISFCSKQLVQDGNDDISLSIRTTRESPNVRFDGDFSPSGLVKPRSCRIIASEGSRATATSRLCRSASPGRCCATCSVGSDNCPCLRPIPTHDGRLLLSTYARTMAGKPSRRAMVRLADRQLVELVAHLLDPDRRCRARGVVRRRQGGPTEGDYRRNSTSIWLVLN